ncbi:haloalkane dehalogenase [Paracidovorax sp. MALMAid1276]|uniref:haloalkane dehalogenase n=1 Tax=Paracidovorax sp. MALMAid1276 TaxID=3411631 RepID=UPI003B9CAE58
MTSINHLRTPDECFRELPGYPWRSNYTTVLPALGGLQMHYLDEGPRDAPVTWLCLHGNPGWSYLYRHMIPVFIGAGHRVLAPDMPGFGKSDKPIDIRQHTFGWHRQVLLELVEAMDLQRVHLVVQDWGGLLGLTLPMAATERYSGLLIMNTYLATAEFPLPEGFLSWRAMCRNKPDFSISRLFARSNSHLSAEDCAGYDAPFPSLEYRAATQAFPDLVPEHPEDDGVEVSREAAVFWREHWRGRSMMAIGGKDPVFTPEAMERLRLQIRGCPPPMLIAEGGHFVQEHGGRIAHEALRNLL